MRKILLNFLLICCFSAESATKVELNLRAVVCSQLNIERIDNNGDIDLFGRKESRYRVISNEGKNVIVAVDTANKWKAKRDGEGENKEIPYRAKFTGDGNKEAWLSEGKNEVKIENSEFENNQYEFSLVFYTEQSINTYSAGTYTDTITVNVVAE